MTLKQMVELYDGLTVFDVCRAIDAGTEDVITFTNDDMDAVKDAILAEKVLKYSVGVSNHLTIVLEAKATTTSSSSSGTGAG